MVHIAGPPRIAANGSLASREGMGQELGTAKAQICWWRKSLSTQVMRCVWGEETTGIFCDDVSIPVFLLTYAWWVIVPPSRRWRPMAPDRQIISCRFST